MMLTLLYKPVTLPRTAMAMEHVTPPEDANAHPCNIMGSPVPTVISFIIILLLAHTLKAHVIWVMVRSRIHTNN